MSVLRLAGFDLHRFSRDQIIVWAIMAGALGILIFAIASGAHAGLLRSSATSVEGGVLALSSNGRQIAVLSPFDGELLGSIALEHEASQITPTPGGVSVFVSFVDREEVRIYSTTEYELQEVVSFPGRVPDHLLFSENGDSLFVSYDDVPVISVFNHSMRSLDLSFEFELPGSHGPVYRNRRATRLYRATPAGLATIFAANGEVIETLPVSPAVLGFNPDYTHIWALETDLSPAVGMSLRSESRSGVPLLVDERSGSMSRIDAVVTAGPVFVTAGGEHSGSDNAAFLSESRNAVLFFDSRTGEQQGELELPFAAEKLLDSGVGTIWAVGADGSLAVIDPVRESVRQPGRGPSTLAAAGNGGEQLDGARMLVTSVVQSEGNFACF